MTTNDFVHLVLYAAGEVRGRTKLQKLVYFAGELAGVRDSLGYGPHYYGPFSPEVAGAVDDLRGVRFLEQRTSSTGATDPQGFEVTRYDYRLTPDGEKMAEEKARANPEIMDKIRAAVQLFGSTDYVKLSIAAKAFFLLGHAGGSATPDELQAMTGKFGWTVTGDQLVEAGRLLASADLIKIPE